MIMTTIIMKGNRMKVTDKSKHIMIHTASICIIMWMSCHVSYSDAFCTSFNSVNRRRMPCLHGDQKEQQQLHIHQLQQRWKTNNHPQRMERIKAKHSNEEAEEKIDSGKIKQTNINSTRRKALQQIVSTSAVISMLPMVANAGIAEIDSKSGELFSPKKEMLGGGGSDAARGLKLQSREKGGGNSKNSATPIQTIYDTRFITYLARFLLNFDPAANAWWREQNFDANGRLSIDSQKKLRFAEFAESVEIGLADYFTGPYGSYASVQAAVAGLKAAAPAASSPGDISSNSKRNVFDLSEGLKRQQEGKKVSNAKGVDFAKQGLLNLFSLLKTRYISIKEKQQLALLFSLVTDEALQPTAAIKGLLGEIDNGGITEVKFKGLLDEKSPLVDVRRSSHLGGGYSVDEIPVINIEAPPGLGDNFQPAKLEPIMKQTSRILRIDVVDGGKGYSNIPKVEVLQNGVKIACDSCAILDRNGSVDSIVVLKPGFGYSGNDKSPIDVRIAAPKIVGRVKGDKSEKYCVATAIAHLEYEIADVRIVSGGNGYLFSDPPEVTVTPPRVEPDWYMKPIDQTTWQVNDFDQVGAYVYSMESRVTGERFIVEDEDFEPYEVIESNPSILKDLENDPLALFPYRLRPYFIKQNGVSIGGVYSILSLPPPQSTTVFLPSPRYRAYDPIFGGIGAKPVIKGAQSLTGSEYARLALSGAVCTVLVRTALNPLELVKTKIQLQNDDELLKTINEERSKTSNQSSESSQDASSKIGTLDVIRSLVDLRGPSSLFQSADITFLASVVFGSFGFGATELFRRYFTNVFFGDTGGSKGTEEITLLLAAAIACVLTAAFAAPFELLRVRSMAYVDAKPVKTVFFDFLSENRKKSSISSDLSKVDLTIKDIIFNDLKPLFGGFYPIVSRELPFAVIKFLAFDLIASSTMVIINSQPQIIEPLQVGAGPVGLAVSAGAGAVAGLFGAVVSHPADLILTLTSSQKQSEDSLKNDWKTIVQSLLEKEGGILNLYAGFPARASFFFLVIGLQFFLYDYAKTVFQVGSDDLTLVLDVFYAIRQGLVDMGYGQ